MIDFKLQHPDASLIDCQQIAKSIQNNIDFCRKVIDIANYKFFWCICFKILYSREKNNTQLDIETDQYILKVWCFYHTKLYKRLEQIDAKILFKKQTYKYMN